MITEPAISLFVSPILAKKVTEIFNEFACEYHVTTPLRVAAFMSQLLDDNNLSGKTEDVIKALFETWHMRSINRYADIQFFEEICMRTTHNLFHFSEKIVIYNTLCNSFGISEYVLNKTG